MVKKKKPIVDAKSLGLGILIGGILSDTGAFDAIAKILAEEAKKKPK